MVNLEVLEDVHQRMYDELTNAEGDTTATTSTSDQASDQRQCDSLDDAGDTTGTEKSLGNQYYIARDESNGIYLPAFLKDPKNATDPAFKVCTKLPTRKNTT